MDKHVKALVKALSKPIHTCSWPSDDLASLAALCERDYVERRFSRDIIGTDLEAAYSCRGCRHYFPLRDFFEGPMGHASFALRSWTFCFRFYCQKEMTMASADRPFHERVIHRIYSRVVKPFVRDPLVQQRLKMLWYVWGYWPLIARRSQFGAAERLALLIAFLRVDWLILHAHTPREVADIAVDLGQGMTTPGQAIVEAGCWNGGSAAKFSHLALHLNLSLHVYDSFQGVEDVSNVAGEWDYSGQYASAEATVRRNIERCGSAAPYATYPGWFSETLGRTPVAVPVAMAYIDCDIAKGTYEALSGIVGSLAPHAIVFSQDFHIAPVSALLTNPETWARLGVAAPRITRLGRNLAKLSWDANLQRIPRGTGRVAQL